jgi:hypothetical protein
MIDPFLLTIDKEDNCDLYAITLSNKLPSLPFHFVEENDNDLARFLPDITLEGTGLFIGRHGYTGMGDFYSNTHGNTGMGFF